MPAIRQIQINNSQIQINDRTGSKILSYSNIPSTMNTVTKAENWINTTWIPANITAYQAQAHVFSINPLVCTFGTWDLGLTIPLNWWQ